MQNSGFEVPAHAEIIIEGEVLMDQTEPEAL